MKKVMVLSLILISLLNNVTAQTIVSRNGKMGLLFPSGNAALQYEYDNIIHAETGGHIQPLFHCIKNGSYGIYNMYDSTFTGCVFDTAYVHSPGIVIMKRDNKIGFIGCNRSTLAWKTVEPAYDQIEWFGKEITTNFEFNEEPNDILQVRLDTLWGLVSQTDGKIVAPIHFRYRLEHYSRGGLYVSIDRKNQQQILFDPRTGYEYSMSFLAEVDWMPEWKMLVSVDYFTGDSVHTRIWNTETGVELWNHPSKAANVSAVLYTPNIIMITEEYREVWNNEEKVVYTFYTVSDLTTRLTYTGDTNTRIHTSNEDDRILVYVSKTYNGKMKQIGEILKK